MRVVFMGTPDFSIPALAALLDAGHEIVAVYTQPPRPAGRGKKDRASPVHQFAHDQGIEVRHPVSLTDTKEHNAFARLNADIAVVVAYGLILPKEILDAPRFGCLNIHASLLPRWRGAAPIHRAILAGDTKTGVCIMQMDQGLDTGPVLLREKTAINSTDTTASLHDRLSEMGAHLIVQALDRLQNLTAHPQPDDGVTYADKIDKAEARLDWSLPAIQVDRQIRGLSPFPGAWSLLDGERIKLLQSVVTTGSGTPGVVLDDQLCIACGERAIQILRLQKAGGSAQDTDSFLRGQPVSKGAKFGS